jgi:hypothetical protein
MKNEIDKDWYCSTAGMNDCPDRDPMGVCAGCPDCHRKWPTPEQFKEEYGEEWKDAFYFLLNKGKVWRSILGLYNDKMKESLRDDLTVVCACTPWGKPPNGWKPV